MLSFPIKNDNEDDREFTYRVLIFLSKDLAVPCFSVSFPFDVHAMIYTDDAPALETALHREFNSKRVNAVNLRKEFFNVDLASIQEAVEKIVGIEAEFKITALAEDYYESLRLSEVA